MLVASESDSKNIDCVIQVILVRQDFFFFLSRVTLKLGTLNGVNYGKADFISLWPEALYHV